jgi:hypothetical protein
MNKPALVNKIYAELRHQNEDVNRFVDEVLEHVMNDNELQNRTDWDEIQRTINLVIKSMDAVEEPIENESINQEQSELKTDRCDQAK